MLRSLESSSVAPVVCSLRFARLQISHSVTRRSRVTFKNKDQFIEKASHDPVALGRLYNMTGCVLDLKKQYEEALSYFKKAVQTSPNDVLLYANIAEMYYKMKNPEKAVYYAKKTKEKGGTSDMADEIIKNKGVISEK